VFHALIAGTKPARTFREDLQLAGLKRVELYERSAERPTTTSEPGHAVELALADALRAATDAGEWAAVAALATELGERRRERTTITDASKRAKPTRRR
jgi:hypothetical protein